MWEVIERSSRCNRKVFKKQQSKKEVATEQYGIATERGE
jgi:hypothetical protein